MVLLIIFNSLIKRLVSSVFKVAIYKQYKLIRIYHLVDFYQFDSEFRKELKESVLYKESFGLFFEYP
jgi:hypothetical protein